MRMTDVCLTPDRLASKLLMLIFLASTLPAHAQPDTTTLVCRAESQVFSYWNDDGTFKRADSDKADDVYIFSLSYAEITYRSASKRSEEFWSEVEGSVGDRIRESAGKEKACACNYGSCVYQLQTGKNKREIVGLTCAARVFAFNPQTLFFLETNHVPDGIPFAITKAGSCSRL